MAVSDSNVAERWLPIPGYEGLYSVSSLGRVCSYHRKTPKILKPGRLPVRAYQWVNLQSGGIGKHFYVHSLVCLAFIGPRPSGYQVNHLNGIYDDNRVENLEYVTPAENMKHADTILGHVRRGEARSKLLTNAAIVEIRRLYKTGFVSQYALARQFGVCQAHISRIVLLHQWVHI